MTAYWGAKPKQQNNRKREFTGPRFTCPIAKPEKLSETVSCLLVFLSDHFLGQLVLIGGAQLL